ncbi:anthranilate synthase component I [Cytobacillus purgationiresistens]|uniref:Anthranilate synthase component 1 n=1 Tax=Cytobacillus purgationiresistens TaxID=863449 RepID=A0ABU0AGJ0_9BACI|nr:anthranilate synthase component I [Cytobacillus purgationiresistens]MDQ0270368.1 anthranilate synthase component 1 [Cytobacillus purgationiresistens]
MQSMQDQIVTIELEGDTLTPILIYQRLKGKKKFLFESSLKHEKSGRYSFIGADPLFEITGFGGKTIVLKDDKEELIEKKPLDVLSELLPHIDESEMASLPFIGGAVGYAGYDAIREYEKIGGPLNDEIEVPDVHFMFFEEIAVFDHLEQKVTLLGIPIQTSRIDLEKKLTQRKKEIIENTAAIQRKELKLSSFKASMEQSKYIEKVKEAKEHIVEGDIFQVVLSQRLTADIEGDPFTFYRRLRVQNPSPYMYYIDFGDYVIAGASPESLVKVTGNQVITNPIAGTRPRGKTEQEDKRLEKELAEDEKEIAEHRMLLDLGRNDLGRVCEFGTVAISKYMEIEKYKHVMHLVSEVGGTLREGISNLEALVACLPAGTVSGAPKIRAMEIINELEEVKRGIYSGAIGYLSANGNMDFALAIRTMVAKGNKAYIQAGAGIVHDSIPEKEYEETIHKLSAFLEADHDFID